MKNHVKNFCIRGAMFAWGGPVILAIVWALLQAAGVVTSDYLDFYLLNGWIPLNRIWIFTLIFVAGFVVIWFSIFIPIKLKVDKMNQMLNKE